MQSDIDRLKQIPVIDVASSLGLIVKGRKALCFSGHDKNPSLSFHIPTNSWRCFGCGLKGSNIDLVMAIRQATFREAVAWMSSSFGLPAQLRQQGFRQKPRLLARAGPTKQLRRTPAASADPEVYQWLLAHCPLSEFGRSFAHERWGLTKTTLDTFKLAEVEFPSKIFSALIGKWGIDRLSRCGLAVRQEDAGRSPRFVWWRRSLIIPFYLDGKAVYLQARTLADVQPKYVGLKDVEKSLFNLDITRSAGDGTPLFICEGVPDTLAVIQSGWNAVGVLGATSFRTEWVHLLSRFRIAVIPDNDQAGRTFAASVQAAFEQIGKSIAIVRLPEGKDAADYLSKQRTA